MTGILQALLASVSAAVSAVTDEYFEYVTMLLPGNGTNGAQNNTFLDSSTNNFTITRNGNTTQGTFSPYGDNWSNYFDGTSDALTTNTTNSGWQLGTGDFEIAFWIYPESVTGNKDIFTQRNASGTPQIFLVNNVLRYNNALIAGILDATVNIVTNKWQYCVLSRVSGTTRWFIDGVAAGSISDTNNWSSTDSWWVSSTAQSFQGYISNLRLVKGSGVTSVTVPTAPLTAISGTTFLSCQSNRFKDNSSNDFALTLNGNVSVQRFSPFSPTAAYASGTIGGSGYFDGTGDNLSIADDAAFEFGSGDFTIELWVSTTQTGYKTGVSKWQSGQFSWMVRTHDDGDGKWQFFYSTDGSNYTQIAGADINDGAWHHLAVSRSGSNIRLFTDGTLNATNTNNPTLYNGTAAVVVGSDQGTNNFLGYIAGLRILKGTAQYTAAFTPPTAPPTAITNTSLLCNFTNAGIIDNAMMNDLETVGNAQISTSVSKFGGGSMYFDGTDDYLTLPNSVNLDQIGDFTHECWYYRSGAGAGQLDIVFIKNVTNYLYLAVDRSISNKVIVNQHNVGTLITGTTQTAANTWYHLAVTRSGSSVRLFVNGTQEGSTTTYSTNTSGSAASYVGGFPAAHNLNGYIDDLRITAGVARYTANFTAPTAAFPTQ